MSEELQSFLARFPAFARWGEEWLGVPLEFRVCLAGELPPRAFVGSVRAVVLRNDQVLLIHDPSGPMLVTGGRCRPEETIAETLIREVAEETGWLVSPLAVIGFIHGRHLDGQRPDWGRPAPDFVDPVFAVNAESYDTLLISPNEHPCEFVAIAEVERLGIEEINRTFLREAQRKR